MKVDVKTAQEILLHANSRIPLDLYQQAVSEERREAQNLAVKVKVLFGEAVVSAPIGSLNRRRKKR